MFMLSIKVKNYDIHINFIIMAIKTWLCVTKFKKKIDGEN